MVQWKKKKMLLFDMVNVMLQVLAYLTLYRVKFYILLNIFWTQKIVIKLVMSYERKKEPHLKYFKVWGCLVKEYTF